MKILVTGSSGLIGQSLISYLEKKGHEVYRLVRRLPEGKWELRWDPSRKEISLPKESPDVVIHLAGESIAKGRWTETKKKRIVESRTHTTRFLCESLRRFDPSPQILLSASAIGFYGNRGNQKLVESSSRGKGFAANLAEAWEKNTEPLSRTKTRIVHLRIGIVLTPQGGALHTMLLPFRMGVGGTLGNGHQYMSWITLEDAIKAFEFVIENSAIKGPVNIVSPNPVTNLEFTKTLGTVLKRPTIFPIPAFAARIVFGEMANELLLASARIYPEILLKNQFSFRHSQLQQALEFLL